MTETAKNPKVFISYAWTSDEYREKVIAFASRLRQDGIDAILDAWDLKGGQNKYAFMEKMVTDPEVEKVLILCNEVYAEKADARKGGVGEETMIITPQVYAKADQTKFIPVIFERNADGERCIPTYLKSNIFFDLDNEDRKEIEYEDLIREILGDRRYKKPPLGKLPVFTTDEEYLSEQPLRAIVQQVKSMSYVNKSKSIALCTRFTSGFVTMLNSFKDDDNAFSEQTFLQQLEREKIARDIYLDFLDEIIQKDIAADEFIANLINTIIQDVVQTPRDQGSPLNLLGLEFYSLITREIFICSVAVLFHYERYEEIHFLLWGKYLHPMNPHKKEHDFACLRNPLQKFESLFAHLPDGRKYLSFAAYSLIQREKHPLITKKTTTYTDIMLCQLSFILHKKHWFPESYVYAERKQEQWQRLRSKRYCTRILPLFGTESIDELKRLIEDNPVKSPSGERFEYGYSDPLMLSGPVPSITSYIKISEIASEP